MGGESCTTEARIQLEFCRSRQERGAREKPGHAVNLCVKDKGEMRSTMNAREFQKEATEAKGDQGRLHEGGNTEVRGAE